MKQKIVHIIKHPLFSGSVVMIIGNNINNVINYVYHIFMGRMLGPQGYGELASLFSLVILVGTIPSSLNLSLVKFVSNSSGSEHLGDLVGWFFSRSFVLALFVFLPFLIFIHPIKTFLNLSSLSPLVLLSLSLILLMPSIVLRSTLQGLLKFNRLILTIISESGIKLILGILFVYLGLSVFGSMLGIVIAGLVGIGLGMLFVNRFKIWPAKLPISSKHFFSYSFPIMIYSFVSTSLFTTDLLLVKHFFSAVDAGTYAALSTLGKIIIFGAGPVSAVMFPIVSGRHSQGYAYHKVFISGLLLTVGICSSILLLFYLFPGLSVNSLYGHQYDSAIPLLFHFGLFVSLYAVSAFLIGFYLSINNTKIVLIPSLVAVMQIIGIILFHNDLLSVINVSTFVSFIMLISLLFLLPKKVVKISV